MLGLAQDARWGRVEESYGEDPYLVSRMGVAYVLGVQGTGTERFDRNHVIACAKHFAGDGCPPGGQNGGAMEISERLMRETHLRPFEAVVREAQCGGIPMANRFPRTSSSQLIQ
jgi:beta-glucosidase